MAVKKLLKYAKGMVKDSCYVYFMNHKPVDDQMILLESKKGVEVGGNILRILEELRSGRYEAYKVYLSVESGRMEYAEKLLDNYGIEGVRLVEFYGIRYFELLATAGFLITDTTFPRRFIKRSGQIYMNTWHGTSFKKLGKDIPSGAYAIGNVQRNLLMTDYLVSPSRYAAEKLRDAHNLENLYQGTYIYAGYPRNQVFFRVTKGKGSDEPQESAGRSVVPRQENAGINTEPWQERAGMSTERQQEKPVRKYCYMPTWRGVVTEQYTEEMKRGQVQEIKKYLDRLDRELEDCELLYVRLHPFVGQKISFEGYRHIRAFEEFTDPYETLAEADCLVTDYSSVFFDYANRKDGKIIFFLYDRNKFAAERDFYGDIEEFPFPVTQNITELLRELRTPKQYDDTEFRNKYCPFDGPDAAKKLCAMLLSGEQPESMGQPEYMERPETTGRSKSVKQAEDIGQYSRILAESEAGNGKKNLLFYVGALKRNGLTTSFLNLMENINPEAFNYYASFQEEYLESEPLRLEVLPGFVKVAPISKGWNLTFMEALASFVIYKLGIDAPFFQKYLRRFYRREYTRNYGFARFDWCIHFSGYEKKVIGFFEEASCKRAIFVHNDMLKEVETRHNQHLPTLRRAYREYDLVAAVTEDIYERTLPISGKKENLRVIHNCHAWHKVLERAEQEIRFDETTCCTCSKEKLEQLLKDSRQKLITIGRFSPEKGHDMLLDAFARYHEEVPDSVLIIIGGIGELYEKTWEKAKSLGLEECVVLIKSIQNPMPILKACDLFVLSSLYEGLGLVILEADTLGLPVISTDVTGPRGFMTKYGGYLVPPDAEGLYQGMKAFGRGEVPVMKVNYEEYNRVAVEEFMRCMVDGG